MAKKQKGAEKTKNSNGANVGYEAELWKWLTPCAAAWMRRGTSTSSSASYSFKYISDAFEEQHAKLEAEKKHGADPEDPDEYRALNIFWVPPEARRAHLKAQAKQATIGQFVDDAMAGIERDNPSLTGVPPKDYARLGLDKQRLGQIIDLISVLVEMLEPFKGPVYDPCCGSSGMFAQSESSSSSTTASSAMSPSTTRSATPPPTSSRC